MKIIFASANKNKIAEIKSLLHGKYEVLGLKEIGIEEDIPEPGATIKENSFLKASYVLNFMKEQKMEAVPVFADDSGLEVTALNNAPGVYSARYAGEPKNDSNNNKKLLSALTDELNRDARFVTVITLIMNNEIHYFEGEVKGQIIDEEKGNTGFGYDPLFVPKDYKKTFAELGSDIKNTISHRAMAIKKLLSFLENKN